MRLGVWGDGERGGLLPCWAAYWCHAFEVQLCTCMRCAPCCQMVIVRVPCLSSVYPSGVAKWRNPLACTCVCTC